MHLDEYRESTDSRCRRGKSPVSSLDINHHFADFSHTFLLGRLNGPAIYLARWTASPIYTKSAGSDAAKSADVADVELKLLIPDQQGKHVCETRFRSFFPFLDTVKDL